MQNNPNIKIDQEKREVVMTRVLDAPRELVFKVYNDPALVPQWWGPRELTTTVEKMDVRPGGEWRFVQRDPPGNRHAFHGVYREVSAPEKIVFTFEYEGMPGHVLINTLLFTEQGSGQTLVTDISYFDTLEDMLGMYQSGMEEGALVTYDRLNEVLRAEKARTS